MSETQSTLSGLVMFIVCLAIAGSIVAGGYHFIIDLPQQNGLQAPENVYVSGSSCACDKELASCKSACTGGMFGDEYYCEMDCYLAYRTCQALC